MPRPLIAWLSSLSLLLVPGPGAARGLVMHGHGAHGLTCPIAYRAGKCHHRSHPGRKCAQPRGARRKPPKASPTRRILTPSAVALPVAPRAYLLPSRAIYVSTSQQLVSALASSASQNIVLANGTYTTVGTTSPTRSFHVSTGARLWAQRLGGAVLQAGLTFGGNYGRSGGEVHGLAFKISDPTLTDNSAAVYT